MRSRVLILGIILALCTGLWAAPMTSYEAEMAVIGWLQLDPAPLETSIGQQILTVETFADDEGEAIYYVVSLQPTGFVIVSADDLVEPIIGFSDDGPYDLSPANPLGALAEDDLRSRLAAVRASGAELSIAAPAEPTGAQKKWAQLMDLALAPPGDLSIMSDPICFGSPSDVRVPALTASKWSQKNVSSSAGSKACYNYYTPQWNASGNYIQWSAGSTANYHSGCVATAMAQLLRYHQYPSAPIGMQSCNIRVVKYVDSDGDDVTISQARNTRGGNGSGGAYKWSDMTLSPTYNTSAQSRQAIGALCYDAGLSLNMKYGPKSSGTNTLNAADGFKEVFQYANAIKGYNAGNEIGGALTAMINPNLDAGNPVMLGIKVKDAEGGHAVVADGYGYHTFSTPYHHLNMGFGGSSNCWYNLPTIKSSARTYNMVYRCVYNVFKSATGEIISGRVLDKAGHPIVGAKVQTVIGGGQVWDPRVGAWVWQLSKTLSDTTDAKGIYALVGVPSGTSCTINVTKTGYEFSGRTVTVGTSEDKEASCGNKWGINFTGTRPGGSTTGTVKVLWDLHHGILEGWEPETGYSDLMAQLEEEGYHVSTTSSGIEAVNLYSYDVLVISVGTSWDSTYGASEVELIRDFVERGGGLLVLGDHPRCPNYIRPVAMDYGFITAIDESYEGDVYITNFTDHPIFRGCSSLYFRVAGSIAYSPGATLVAWDFRRYGVVGVGSPGQGRVVVTGDCDFCRQYYIDERSNKRFAQNLFDWLSKKMP